MRQQGIQPALRQLAGAGPFEAQLPDRAHAGQQHRVHRRFALQVAEIGVEGAVGIGVAGERGNVQAQRERAGVAQGEAGDRGQVVEPRR